MGFFDKLFGKANAGVNKNGIYAPMTGKVVPLTEVPDVTFAEGMLGGGVAILPTEGKVYAPFDGKVDMMFETGHAVSLVSDTGTELLIHVGLETVSLHGAPFRIHVKNGDPIKKGQLLMEADLAAIQAAGLNIITPVVVCNTDDYSTFNTVVNKDVTNEDMVIELDKLRSRL